ncbi:uncharacterized protein LOC111008495 [Momordica charantia]|uniref:Uncharacterized protein LOC111008495 n=1 Tax=Momordica charantia TaxID=3673 RepID=A0A6J1C8U5_MOMCH|nr:uncharacterized protein LOC111008495 [Momordica charantia]
MMTPKGSMLVFIGILLVSFRMIEITNAIQYINYHALKTDVSPGCSPKHPGLCKLHEANSYQRGCSAINRCRRDDYIDSEEKIKGDAKNHIDDDEDDNVKGHARHDDIKDDDKEKIKGDYRGDDINDDEEKTLKRGAGSDIKDSEEKIKRENILKVDVGNDTNTLQVARKINPIPHK